jgi:hypothetical protein
MHLAIMQPYLFPYIGYFQLIRAVDRFVVYDDVAFINRGWINRNNLLVNGQPSLFTVPLREASQNKLIHEIELDPSPKWREKLLRTIEQNYRKAPQFEPVFALTRAVLMGPETHIGALALSGLRAVCGYLGIDTELVETSRQYGNDHLRAQERILDICRQEAATHYTNPSGGQALYDRGAFAQNGIALTFIRPNAVEYPQWGGPFVPGLSILDVLFFNPPERVQPLLDAYELF